MMCLVFVKRRPAQQRQQHRQRLQLRQQVSIVSMYCIHHGHATETSLINGNGNEYHHHLHNVEQDKSCCFVIKRTKTINCCFSANSQENLCNLGFQFRMLQFLLVNIMYGCTLVFFLISHVFRNVKTFINQYLSTFPFSTAITRHFANFVNSTVKHYQTRILVINVIFPNLMVAKDYLIPVKSADYTLEIYSLSLRSLQCSIWRIPSIAKSAYVFSPLALKVSGEYSALRVLLLLWNSF